MKESRPGSFNTRHYSKFALEAIRYEVSDDAAAALAR